jgi:surface protein
MNTMFQNADSFNQPLDNWETSSVENMSNMFLSADLFNQNLNSWDVSSVTNMAGMFDNSGLNLENYDKTLIGWSNLPSLQNDVVFNGGDSQYCESEEARQYLIDTYGWTITDGGKDPLCNQDNDLDGILDHKDNCLNTVPNATVNESGCEIIPNNAISVYGLTPTCPGTANGSIQVSSSLTGRSYNISLDGPTTITENSVSLDQPFVIDNLSTGLYTVEISIPEVSYNQSFGIQINEVGSISGKRENLDLKSKSVSYYVEGSHSYKVNINGKDTLFNFDSIESNQIQLNDLNGFNTISISGKSDCQGIIKDSFNLSNSVVMYPVNTKDKTFIEGYDEQSEVQIFDISGRLLFQKKLDIDKLEFIDIESYDPGMYPVKIISNKNTQTFKIIKQ